MAKYSVYKENTQTISLSFDGVDLTGATVYFTVKSAPDDDATDTTAVIKKDVTSHIDALNGQTVISLTATDTNIAAGKYGYDIKLKTAAGAQTTVDKGDFTIKPVYTNRG
jgi:hypothetical protein